MKKILVSSCLLGKCCKYNGGHNKNQYVIDFLEGKDYVSICPEEMGGLPTPRPPAEIVGGDGETVLSGKGKVLDINGKDVTENFISGALLSLDIAEVNNCRLAILKANSPSCGNKYIYNGTFNGKKTVGMGVTATILRKNNIKVLSEEDLDGL